LRGTTVPVVICAILSLWFALAAHAATLELLPAADNTIYEPAPPFDPSSSELNPSNGAGDFIFAGRVADMNEGLRRRALVGFDLAAQIPAGSIITEVTLRLYLSQTITAPVVTTDVSLHRLTSTWGEAASDASGQEGGGANAILGDATWFHAEFDTTLWQLPGGDFLPQASATTAIGDRNLFYTWSEPRMIADAQCWLDDPGQNFGWILLGDESVSATAKRFDSRDSFSFDLTTNRRTLPVLTVTYVPEPDSAGLMMAALLASLGTRRRAVALGNAHARTPFTTSP